MDRWNHGLDIVKERILLKINLRISPGIQHRDGEMKNTKENLRDQESIMKSSNMFQKERMEEREYSSI